MKLVVLELIASISLQKQTKFNHSGRLYINHSATQPCQEAGNAPSPSGADMVCCIMTQTPPIQSNTVADTLTDRLYLAMLITRLENTLLAAPSATRALENWMAQAPAPIAGSLRVERARGPATPCPAAFAPLLGLPAEPAPLHYRKIRMTCGQLVLSEAENWYRADLLDADMQQALDTTDIPFGRAVGALEFFRQTLARESLWWPLPEETLSRSHIHALRAEVGGQTEAEAGRISLPAHLFRHTALLRTRAGTPFSLVAETYTAQSLLPFLA
jgi:chorismate-pyruvate lyase